MELSQEMPPKKVGLSTKGLRATHAYYKKIEQTLSNGQTWPYTILILLNRYRFQGIEWCIYYTEPI